jgi:class I fructose-bisphosphate aldolase
VFDALRLGCIGIGYTIYPGIWRRLQYEQLRELAREAKSVGLLVVVWAYPRGSGLTKEGETALDVVAYGAQIAAQLGAHLIKVNVRRRHVELGSAEKVYDQYQIPRDTIADRVCHVV